MRGVFSEARHKTQDHTPPFSLSPYIMHVEVYIQKGGESQNDEMNQRMKVKHRDLAITCRDLQMSLLKSKVSLIKRHKDLPALFSLPPVCSLHPRG